jgi:5-methylthioadenosine/S-adenosylhomocysteine deaminase
LGLDREIGSLEPGKQADLIIVETRVPHLTPLHQPASAIVYAARGSDVRTVMVGGRLLVKNRRVLPVDMEDVMHRVGRISQVLSDELKRKA